MAFPSDIATTINGLSSDIGLACSRSIDRNEPVVPIETLTDLVNQVLALRELPRTTTRRPPIPDTTVYAIYAIYGFILGALCMIVVQWMIDKWVKPSN